jgi:rhodanese-related sulfurtransferase
MKLKLLIFILFAQFGCQTAIEDSQRIKQISAVEAFEKINKSDVQFIDVRTEGEYAGGHAIKTANFPLDKLETDFAKLDKSKPVYLICQSGKRSQKAAEILEKQGFTELYNLKGGTNNWLKQSLPTEKP